MSREIDRYAVVDIEPFRVVIHLASDLRNLRHEIEGAIEILELEVAMKLSLAQFPVGK